MDKVTINKESLQKWQEDNLERLRYEYSLLPSHVVLDIGSYHREWGKKIEDRYGSFVIYFDALDNNAAWIFDGEIRMGGQFYYTSHYDEGELGEVMTYKCVDIAKYLKSPVELVKINIEGCEWELLHYIISTGLIKNIRNLQVQFHYVEGLYGDEEYKLIYHLLSETHERIWFYPFCWESWKLK